VSDVGEGMLTVQVPGDRSKTIAPVSTELRVTVDPSPGRHESGGKIQLVSLLVSREVKLLGNTPWDTKMVHELIPPVELVPTLNVAPVCVTE